MKEYFLLAFKNIRKRGVRSWLTLLGIFIGVLTVVSLISLGNGLREGVISQFGISSTKLITVQAGGLTAYGPPGTWVSNPLTKQDAEAIEKLDSVEIAIPRNIETVQVKFKGKTITSLAASLPRERMDFVYETLELNAKHGRLLEKGDSRKVLLGSDFRDKTKNGFGKSISVGDKISIEGKEFRVAGILEKKGSFIIDRIIFMPDEELNDIKNYRDKVNLIAVRVKSKDLMDRAKEDIEKLLRERRDVKKGEEDFEVSTPQAILETVDNVLKGIQIFIVIIALISIVVGSIGIINTMTVSVLERKKDIGIMKAVGLTNKNIFYLFFVEAGLLGLIGGLLGVVFGMIVGYFGTAAINKIIGSSATPEISWIVVILTLIGSFFIGSLAGTIPAIRAAKQNPVEALRG